MSRILLVDDDRSLRTSVRRVLSYEGYAVTEAADGRAALREALAAPPDLVILDVMMPELDGIEVCRRLRAGGDVPILMLTARDEVADRVTGLDAGANDYLCKPFALEELLARVRALLRHRSPARTVLSYADLVMDQRTHEVRRAGTLIPLTAREFDLLRTFLEHPGEVLSQRRLLAAVWNYPDSSNVAEVYVSYLRSKLEAEGGSRMIQTVRGVGYVLRLSEAG